MAPQSGHWLGQRSLAGAGRKNNANSPRLYKYRGHLHLTPSKCKRASIIIQPTEFHVNNPVTHKDILYKNTTFIQRFPFYTWLLT